ncbi:MAG: XisH family protein [Chloroflexi bacterium]|nr:XisH family protein [Chloroflexota bacterium]
MATRDIYHETVKKALVRDGWTITHDPFPLVYGIRRLYADLGAEKLVAAEKSDHKIVVEVKSFIGPSEVADLQEAYGAYEMYRKILQELHPDWQLYLAVPRDAYDGIFSEPLGELMVRAEMSLIVFDPNREVIEEWIP